MKAGANLSTSVGGSSELIYKAPSRSENVVRAGGPMQGREFIACLSSAAGLARAQQTPEALGSLHRAEIEGWWPITRAAVINAN